MHRLKGQEQRLKSSNDNEKISIDNGGPPVCDGSDGTDRHEGAKAPKEMTPEEMTTRMEKELGLTADQKTKVLALNKQYQDVLCGPGMGRPRGPRPDAQTGATQQNQQQRPERPQLTDEQKAQMKQQMEKRKEYDQKLKSILTDKQYKKFQKQHKHGHHGRPGHHGGPRGPRGPRPADIPED